MSLIDTDQDLYLTALTWRRLVGVNGEWTNRLYFRANDKITSEGEAYPDLVPEGTPAPDVPVRERLMTVTEEETEIGWHSDYVTRNRFGQGSAGLRVWQTDVDYSTFLREDWDRFVFRTTDPRPPGQQYITLTPDDINSVYVAKETSYAAYGEQVFEFAHWDLKQGFVTIAMALRTNRSSPRGLRRTGAPSRTCGCRQLRACSINRRAFWSARPAPRTLISKTSESRT